MKYNEKLERLEEIREILSSEADLEESLLLYEESLKLYRELREELRGMQARFDEISRGLEDSDEE